MIHVAGPLDADRVQRCRRCGVWLKDFRRRGLDFPSDGAGPLAVALGSPYPEGALIERGLTYQSVVINHHPQQATCAPTEKSGGAV